MKVLSTVLPEVCIIEPRVFGDERGHFFESWAAQRYVEAGIPGPFVQDNISRSRRGILRGLHLQNPHCQGKLVSVLLGEVYDVAVDVRVGSPSFGRWTAVVLSDTNHRQFWVPPGFAHGFCVTSDEAIFHYKCTEYYHPASEMSVLWNDPALAIDWPVASPIVNEKDSARAFCLTDIPRERLPHYEQARTERRKDG
ncbi:MAG TPA: dTDP-4-dehydrorhamnose 3,5-epimerase [Candidatus Binatia bacterium]|jgi:dTDP-4-dehydrorhamnose 3,5-epimerase